MDSKLVNILGVPISTAKELKAEILRLQNSLKDLGTDQDALQKTTEKLNAAQEEYTRITTAGKQANDVAADSVKGMEREYKNLYKTFELLSDEQRDSDFGKQMAASLDVLHSKLNETKQGVGNFKDNIGNYTNSIIDAFGKMGMSAGGVSKGIAAIITSTKGMQDATGLVNGFSKSIAGMGGPMKAAQAGIRGLASAFKALIANPVGAVIMAIVVAFKVLKSIVDKVREAIRGNEESQMRLKEAMAAFQPVIDAVNNAFDILGQVVVKVIGFFSDAFSKLREIGAAATDFLGITKGANQRIKEQNALYKDLANSQNELTKTKREYQVLDANDKIEVERLRELASETTNVTEKKQLLQEAKEKQAEIDERNIELAQEELRLLETEASLTANDAEINDKLAAAKVKVASATAQLSANARQYNKLLNSGNSGGGKSVWQQEEDEIKKLLKAIEEEGKDEIQKLTEKYNAELALLKKHQKDTTKLTENHQKNIAAIEEKSRQERAAVEANWEKRRIAVIEGNGNQLGALQNQLTAAEENVAKIRKLITDRNWEGFKDLHPPETVQSLKEANIVLGEAALKVSQLKDQIKEVQIAGKVAEIIPGRQIRQELELAKSGLKDYKDFYIDLIEKGKLTSEDYYDFLAAAEANSTQDLINRRDQLKAIIDIYKEEGVDTEARKQYEIEYYNILQQLRSKEIESFIAEYELKKDIVSDYCDTALGGYSDIANAIENMMTTISNLGKEQIQNGKLDEKETEKKKKRLLATQKLMTAVAVTSIVADTASAIMGVWRGYSGELVANAETAAATGPAAAATLAALNTKSLVSAIVKTTSLGATGAAQIAAAVGNHISAVNQLNELGGGEGSSSVAVQPSIIESNPYSYTRTVQTDQEIEDSINNSHYFVSVVDIESGLENRKVKVAETSF